MRRDFFQFHASTKSSLAAEVLTRVAALCGGLIAYAAIRFADARDRVRHAAAEPAG